MFDGVGKASVTGSAEAGRSNQGDGELGVGKQSLVEKTFGPGPHKRGRGDEDDPQGGGGSGHDAKRARGAGGGVNRGFGYRIDAGAIGSFEHDRSAPAANAVRPVPGSTATDAYVGNIITIGRGKDKSPVQVAAQYAAEGFDNPAEASQRFALVVGVNRMESVLDTANQAELDQQVQDARAFPHFPLSAFRRLWRPTWVHDGGPENGTAADFDDVRRAAASHREEAAAAEQHKPAAPVGPMRTAVTHHVATQQYVAMLKEIFSSVYVHVGDADAVNLKAKATPASAAPTGLFNRYDDVLGDARAAGKDPQVVSGGYKFRVGNQHLPEGERHDDVHAGAAGRVAPQTAASADLDMQVRQGLASVDPSAVYMPEPNMLIKSDVADRVDFGKTNTMESKRAVESLNGGKAPDKAWATQHMVLDTRAALYTDGGRFDRDMTQEFQVSQGKGEAYAQGATDLEGLWHPKRNPQSVAKKRELGNAIANMNRNIGDLLDIYLPQQLMKLDQQRQAGGATQTTLDVVHDYLATYATIAGGIEQALRQAMADDEIKIGASKPSKVAVERAGARVHEASPGLAEFSTVALGEPGALAKKIAAAISAAKAFQPTRSKPNPKPSLDDVLALCKAASVATATFLSTFAPEAAQPQPQPQPQPQAAVQAPVPQVEHEPNAMEIDPPGTL